MSSDKTQGGWERQTPLGDEQESYGVNGQWNGRNAATHTDDEHNGNDAVSLANDDGRHSDIVPVNGLTPKTNCHYSGNEDDFERNDPASRKDGNRRQGGVGPWVDNNEVQNDLVPENNHDIEYDRTVPIDDDIEQVRQIPLNDYGARQNDNVSGDVAISGRNGAVNLDMDGPVQTRLTPLETKDREHVGTVSGTDPDIVEVTTVCEIDNDSGVNQAMALDDENKPQDGAVYLDKDRQVQTRLSPLATNDRERVGTVNGTDSDIAEATTVSETDNDSGFNEAVAIYDGRRPQDGAVAWGNNEIVQDNFSGDPRNNTLLMITDRNTSYIRPAVIHIGSLRIERFRFSETVEGWAWPFSDEG